MYSTENWQSYGRIDCRIEYHFINQQETPALCTTRRHIRLSSQQIARNADTPKTFPLIITTIFPFLNSCSKCSLMTPVENAVPRDPTKKFVHCDGKCGHQLLIVPADAESFVCPAENMVRYPRHHAVQKNGPAGSKTLLRTTESAFPSWSGSAALDTKFPSQVGAGL